LSDLSAFFGSLFKIRCFKKIGQFN